MIPCYGLGLEANLLTKRFIPLLPDNSENLIDYDLSPTDYYDQINEFINEIKIFYEDTANKGLCKEIQK